MLIDFSYMVILFILFFFFFPTHLYFSPFKLRAIFAEIIKSFLIISSSLLVGRKLTLVSVAALLYRSLLYCMLQNAFVAA